MNALDVPTNQRYSNEKPIINMTRLMRSQIVNLHNTALLPIAATRDELVERVQNDAKLLSMDRRD